MALLNLSLEERNRSAITAAGAIKPLVYALRTGTASAKQNVACVLLRLSGIEENRATTAPLYRLHAGQEVRTHHALPPLLRAPEQGERWRHRAARAPHRRAQ